MITSSLMMLGLVLLRLGSFMAAALIGRLQLGKAVVRGVQSHSPACFCTSPAQGKAAPGLEGSRYSLAVTAAAELC